MFCLSVSVFGRVGGNRLFLEEGAGEGGEESLEGRGRKG